MPTVKIGVGALVRARIGSVEMPEETKLCCPRCGEPAADQGQCIVALVPLPVIGKLSKTGHLLTFSVDCRACGCGDSAVAVDMRP